MGRSMMRPEGADISPRIPAICRTWAMFPLAPEVAIREMEPSRMLSTFVFPDPTLTAQTTVVSATDLNQVREALAGVYTKDGVTLPTYTNTIATGSTILALDIKETRDAVVARGG